MHLFIKNIWLVSFLLILVLTSSCKEEKIIEPPSNLEHSILFIEDLEHNGGNYSGNFGDIVLFNIDSNKKYAITRDDYFDRDPIYYPNYGEVIFESKRENLVSADLNDESKIYKLDLKTRKISQFFEDKADYKVDREILDKLIRPSLTFGENKLLFSYEDFSKMDSINFIVYDVNSNQIKKVKGIGVDFGSNYFLSMKYNRIYYDAFSLVNNVYKGKIYLIDLKSEKSKKIFDKGDIDCRVLDLRNEFLLIRLTDSNSGSKCSLINFDINSQSVSTVIEYGLIAGKIKDAKYGRSIEEIIFIQTEGEDENYKSDIFRFSSKGEKLIS